MEMKGRRAWAAAALAVAAYLYGLGGQNIPKIGDEAVYLQIARVTGASGALLPLRSELGVNDTKPPLLFWTGAAATAGGRLWSAFAVRLPVALYSLALAVLCGLCAWRLSRDREAAWLAGLSFLCFHSTFQHGRPFLTNVPEAFWLFLPYYLILRSPSISPLALGACIGVGLLHKSFVDAVPACLALAWHRRKLLDPRALAAGACALAVFMLWPALDPERGQVYAQFFLAENFAKVGGGERAALSGHGYLWNALFGPYHVGRVWGGLFVDAGLMALPLAAILPLAWKRRREVEPGERLMWLVLASYALFYTVPSQRQENYLIAATPAAAVLLGLYWKRLRAGLLAAFAAPLAAVFAAGLALSFLLTKLVAISPLHFAVPAAGLAATAWALASPRRAPALFHGLVLAAYLTISCALAPFDGPAGRHSPAALERLKGRVVYAPTGWDHKPRTEYYRFAWPGADVRGFDPENAELRKDLLAAGKLVGARLPLGAAAPEGCRAETSRLVMKSRLPGKDVLALLKGELGRLIEQEAILACARGAVAKS
jgi:hypothetical protein